MTWLVVRAFLGGALSKLWAFLRSLSFWQIMFGLALIFAGIQTLRLWGEQRHSHKLETQLVKINAEIARKDAEVRKANEALKQVSKQLKDRTDEENRRIAGDAHSLRVSGPGKAQCRPAPAAPGGNQGGAKPDAAGPPLPPDDRAGVPWSWLVGRAEEHDQLRAEVQAWHDWYAALLKNWPKN